MKLTHLSLFTGIGGLDLAAELLPDAVQWLRERIRDPEHLREASERVAKYLKYLGDDTQ